MCSIIGYSGSEIAAPIIVKGLKRMEYRGYDSVGVATESENQIELKKGTGKVTEVNSKFQLDTLPGRIGIGHATADRATSVFFCTVRLRYCIVVSFHCNSSGAF